MIELHCEYFSVRCIFLRAFVTDKTVTFITFVTYRQMQLNHLASMAKWLISCLQSKSLQIRNPLEVTYNFRYGTCFEQGGPWYSGNYECRFTPKIVRHMIKHTGKSTVQISTHNTSQSFGQYGWVVECSMTN